MKLQKRIPAIRTNAEGKKREELMQCRGEGLDEQWLLLGEDGPEVEDELVVFNARDHRNPCWRAAKPLLELCSGISGAGEAD